MFALIWLLKWYSQVDRRRHTQARPATRFSIGCIRGLERSSEKVSRNLLNTVENSALESLVIYRSVIA